MVSSSSSTSFSEREFSRKIRAHRKSRAGCGNCKLRRVKCDESKPCCRRCTAFGVLCNYDGRSSDLQLSINGAVNLELLQRFPGSLKQGIPGTIVPGLSVQSMATPNSNACYELREQDLELLSKFQLRTVNTISAGKRLRIYQNEVIKLACAHPFLMHAVLALTLMHDRHLSAASNTKLTQVEAFHWYRGTALFNFKLSGPIQPHERDALWATAAFFGTIAFYYVDAATPEEAWPLKPPSSLDLNWLGMTAGKNEIWKITEPLRADSVFQALALENATFVPEPPTGPGLEVLPPEFIALYGLDATSTRRNNPYQAAASILAKTLNVGPGLSVILNFLFFISHMSPDYKRLLEEKDSRALLLLAYWYTKVYQCRSWWICRRAALECQAICIYLQRYHQHEASIQKLLQFPKMLCGTIAY